jgi:small glutamine-rich tetratricopeptide repeat-containing protein alpha
VEEFKIEGNRAMASFDYERAVSLYTQGIQLKPEGDLLMTLYTNRAQAYLSLKKYQNAESDATNALEVNPNHVKSLHRLSQAKYYLYKLKEAENLLLKILSLEKSAECDEYLKTVRKEMEKKRLEVIDKMVSGGKYYNGNSNAVSILEIDS